MSGKLAFIGGAIIGGMATLGVVMTINPAAAQEIRRPLTEAAEEVFAPLHEIDALKRELADLEASAGCTLDQAQFVAEAQRLAAAVPDFDLTGISCGTTGTAEEVAQ